MSSFFGQNLALIRKEKKLSLTKLATIMNANRELNGNYRKVTAQHLSKFENDDTYRASRDMILELIQALELNPENHRWEIRQLYESAGFIFDRMMAIGQGKSKVDEAMIDEEPDPVRQMTLRYAKALAEQQKEKALNHALKALELYANGDSELQAAHKESKIYGNIGTAYLTLGQQFNISKENQNSYLQEAIHYFETAIKKEPYNSFFHVQLGHTHFTFANLFYGEEFSSIEWEYSMASFKRAISYYSPHSDLDIDQFQETHFYLGYTYINLALFAEAHSIVNTALFLSNKISPLGYYLKACILSQEQKLRPRISEGDILKYLKKCVAIDKTFKSMIIAERFFKHLHTNSAFKKLVLSELRKK